MCSNSPKFDRSFGALLKQLPNKSEMEALLIEVNQAGLGRGLQFELFRPSAEQAKEFLCGIACHGENQRAVP